MTDDEFIVCIRRRMLFDDPAGQAGSPCALRSRRAQHPCGISLRQLYGSHALCCNQGPSFVSRHDGIRDCLATWCPENLAQTALKEQNSKLWLTIENIKSVDEAIVVFEKITSMVVKPIETP